MLDAWLVLPAWVLFVTLGIIFGTTGITIHRACFTSNGQPRWAGLGGVVGPFFTAPHTLFALTAVFLASDAWRHSDQAERYLLDEQESALTIHSLSRLTASNAPTIEAALRTYVQAVLSDEWPPEQSSGSPKVAAAIDALLQAAANPSLAREMGAGIQAALVAAVLRMAEARSGRLALRFNATDDLKWGTALMLGFLAQVGIAIVHLERPRAQALALIVHTTGVVIMIGMIAVCERPFDGSRQVKPAHLQTILQTLGT